MANRRHVVSTTLMAHLLIGLMALLGVLFILLCTSRYGAGTSPDSIAYISAARNVMSGHGYYQYDGSPFMLWPPLFPTVLSFLGLGGVDPLVGARYVNAGAFGLLIFSVPLYVLHSFRSTFLALLSSLATFLAMPLINVSVFVWSESIFVLLIFLSIWSIERFLTKRRLTLLLLSGTLTGLAFLTRYAGLALVITVVLLLLGDYRAGFLTKLRNVALFALPPVLLITPWFIRNFLLSDTLMGERVPSAQSLRSNVLITMNTITKWFLPDSVSSLFRLLIVSLVLMLALSALILVQWRNRQSWEGGLPKLIPLASFFIIYVGYLIISASTTAFDVIDDRLLSPVYIPIVLVLLIGTGSAISISWKPFLRMALGIPLAIIAGVWLTFSLIKALATTDRFLKEGAGGYSIALWHDSQLISYLKQNLISSKIYSNAPDAIYLLTAQPAKWSPSKYAYNSPGVPTHDLEEFTPPLPATGVYLAWFNARQAPHLYSVKELETILELKALITTSDGSIFQVIGPIASAEHSIVGRTSLARPGREPRIQMTTSSTR